MHKSSLRFHGNDLGKQRYFVSIYSRGRIYKAHILSAFSSKGLSVMWKMSVSPLNFLDF